MSTAFAEVHDELRAVARDLLGAPRPVDWAQLAAAGWLGLEVPEALGGAGATFAEAAVVLEELGRAVAPVAYLGTAVLGVGALALAAPGAGRDRLLAAAAAGEARLAVALVDGTGDVVPAPVPFRLERTPAGATVHGTADFVPDAGTARDLVLLAVEPGGGPVLVHVPAGREGVRVEARAVLDETRDLASVTAAGAPVDEGSVWPFAADPGAAVGRLRDRAAVALACDSLGLARAMLDATVAYAGVRVQFGRPIGSFQAVKHACADLRVTVSVTERLVAAAVDSVAGAGDPSGEAGRAASMAKAHAGAAAVEVAGTALQLHGGIGYTWESGIHRYLKRALLDRALFGSPAAHRRFLGERFRSAGAGRDGAP